MPGHADCPCAFLIHGAYAFPDPSEQAGTASSLCGFTAYDIVLRLPDGQYGEPITPPTDWNRYAHCPLDIRLTHPVF